MRRIRNRVQTTTGTGGGGGDVVGNVQWGTNFGNTNSPIRVATSMPSMEIQYDGITAKVSTALTDMSLTELVAGTSKVAIDTGTVTRDYSFGSNSVTQTAVGGRSDWAAIANASGANNGTNATIAGNALEARGGRLNLAYADIPDFTTFGFTVVSAHLDFYTSQAGTTLGNGNLQHQYSVGGAITTLATFTGNVTNNPATYDITSAITSQATLDALTAYVPVSYAIANLSSSTCDAVVLRMEVTHAL